MKKIISILGEYYKDHFNWLGFLLCAVLGAVLIRFAYHNNFYETYIEDTTDVTVQVWRYIQLYAIAFIGAFVVQGIAERDLRFLRSVHWWFLSSLGIGLFAVRGSDIDFAGMMFGALEPDTFVFYSKLGYNLAGFFVLVVPCFIYWLFADRKYQGFYGFRVKQVSFYPYFVMLAIMIPLLFWAGTQADFLNTYPRYTKIGISPDRVHYAAFVWVYELVYGADFVFTEFFFRGFIILAFAKKFGHRAILPMCVYYITIHFGKPIGETISSFFGGLLLGVIAFRTRSVYGGIIVHMGIAYLMELFAFLGRSGYLHF